MLQPASENKYRFDMLVSARAMGSHTLKTGVTAPARSIFEIFDQWIALVGADRRCCAK
jgi:hypothetical protein